MTRVTVAAAAAYSALALIWGTQFLVIRLGQRTLPPLFTMALRFSILALVGQLACWALAARAAAGADSLRGRLGTRARRLAFGGVQALSMGLLYWAEGHLASALAAIVSSTEPLMVALLARRFLAERVAARTIAAQVLGLCGLGLIFARRLAGEPMPGLEPLALAAVLLSAASGAAGRVLGKALVDAVPAAVLLRDVGCCLALAAALGHALLERGRPLGFDAGAVAAFLYLGLVGSAAASALYLALLRRARVSSIAYLQLVTALVGVLTGVVVGGERLGPPAALGCGAVLAGLALQLRGRSASAEQPRDAARREQRRGDGEREEGDAEEHEAADHGAPGRGTSSR